MTDNEIITNMMKFQNFIHTKRFLAPQNHHIVFGHDIDWDKAISKRLKKYGMLPVDNDNKNYFCISNDNIIEYDNGTGIQVDSYKIAKPILTQEHINNFQQFKQHHDHTRQYSNRNCQNNANKNLRQYKKPRYKTNKYSNQNMRDIFLKVIANRQNLSKYNHNYNKKYI